MVLITTISADIEASFPCVLEHACPRVDVKMHCLLPSVYVPACVCQSCARKLILAHKVSLDLKDTDDVISYWNSSWMSIDTLKINSTNTTAVQGVNHLTSFNF